MKTQSERLIEKLDKIAEAVKLAQLERQALRSALYNLVLSVEFAEANRGVKGIKYAKVGEPGILSLADALRVSNDTLATIPAARYETG